MKSEFKKKQLVPDRWSLSKELFAKKKSLQRKFFAKKRMQRKQRKIFLEIQHFWDILPWKSPFFGHFPHDPLLFFKQFNNKMSVTEKSFSKNHKFHGIFLTTLIHYYKIELNHVIFISKIFFAFSLFLCKEFKFFFASSQRMKSAKIWPVYSWL